MALNSKDIHFYEEQQLNNVKAYNINQAYVLGKNPTIFMDETKKKPDNRIPVPLAKSAVEDMTGFAASVGNIKHTFNSPVGETDADKEIRMEYIELNSNIYNHNDALLETTELYEQGLTQGVSYELFWTSDDLDLDNGTMTPEFTLIDNKEIVLIWSSDIKPTLEAAIRYWISGSTKHANVYYPLNMKAWKKPYKGKDIIIGSSNDGPWIRDEEGDTTYPYTDVPLAIYKINRHSQPLFEAEKAMIDAHDNLISKSVNEVDRFNALIALFPDSVDADFIRNLEQYKVVDDLGEYERWPEYMEKSLQKIEVFYNTLADRLKKYIHMTMKVPDFSDESFAGNQSGVAIRFKLMGMEFKAASIDAYFFAGIRTRNKLINQVLNSGTKQWDNYKLTIDSKRNIPIDDEAKAEVAMKLMGIVSRETLLKYLPEDIVEDVDKELEILEEELMVGIVTNKEQ